ncbi:MAG: hypothetical protein HF962_04750 [Sulfurovum sp.]|nr:hypothetical protein [Sulfurovum sp.]
MRKVALTVNGMRFKTKELDEGFVDFVEDHFRDAQINLHEDNSAERLFIAYLKLAGKYYRDEKEIKSLLKEIESL